MPPAHEKLHGLDRNRLLAAVEPVLRAHNVEGVELMWRTDRSGHVLEVTIERPESRVPGAGITIDLCSEVSRDLSAALDVADVIPHRYSLQVGSPGLERALYRAQDYERFAGRSIKVKLKEPRGGQYVISGTLHGLDETGAVSVETDKGLASISLDEILKAHLVLEWNSGGSSGARSARRRASRQPQRRSKRSR